MCSAVRRRMLSKGTVSSPVDAAAGAEGPCRAAAAARTSLRVMRPPSPLPCTSLASRPDSLSNRRTTGDMSCPPVDAGDGAAEVVLGTGSRRGGGVGDGADGPGRDGAGRSGCGGAADVVGAAGCGCRGAGSCAGGGCRGAAEVAAAAAPAPPAPSEMTARRVPTSAVSPSWTRISLSVPDAGAGTSESTLSVETSNSGSSASTWSPTLFSQRVIVPSVTVSPSCGIWMSTRGPPSSGVPASTGERQRRLAEQLAPRRGGMDERPHLRGARLPVDREVAPLEQLGRPRAGDVHTEHRPVPLGDDLHQAVGLADDERPAVPAEALYLRHDVVPELARVLLGVPGERDLGMAVDPPGDLLVVDRRRLLAEDRLDGDDRLGEPHVRELRRVHHVAHGIHARHRRP